MATYHRCVFMQTFKVYIFRKGSVVYRLRLTTSQVWTDQNWINILEAYIERVIRNTHQMLDSDHEVVKYPLPQMTDIPADEGTGSEEKLVFAGFRCFELGR